MTSFQQMKYGPLGEAIEATMPSSEADPIGVWAASLSLFSSAISRSVRLDNGRPVVVWTVLAGRSAIGRKGYALNTARTILKPVIGGYLDTRIRDGISSGASLVDMLAKLELETMGTEGGTDGRALVIEEEWAAVLKTQKRDRNFSTLFRSAWDGKTISNRTKKEGWITVQRPLLGFHSHITPGEWGAYVSSKDALGGSYNRLLPVLVEASKMLPYNNKMTPPDVPNLKAAYRWATEEERVIEFERAAGERFDELRALIEARMAEMPELLASYMERAAEQIQRIAAVLAITEKRTKIPRKAVEAAWAFIQYSMASVEKLVKEAAAEGGRPVRSAEERIREVLARYGGEASSTILLRSLGSSVNAAAVKEAVESMDDVEVYKLNVPGQRGAKPVMYRLIPEPSTEPEAVPQEAPTERPVLRVVGPAPASPKKAPAKRGPAKKTAARKAPAKRPAARSTAKQKTPPAPAAPANPIAGLI
ncbi:DUF3987 domain-containing protein [Streptomyces sp. NPDC003444]